jgi:hypothetical protein
MKAQRPITAEELFYYFRTSPDTDGGGQKITPETTGLMTLYGKVVKDFPGLSLSWFTNFLVTNFKEFRNPIPSGAGGFEEAYSLQYNPAFALEAEQQDATLVEEINQRLLGLENAYQSVIKDFAPMNTRMDVMAKDATDKAAQDNKFFGDFSTELSGLTQRLDALETQLQALQPADLTPVWNAINALKQHVNLQ